jgi:hypothetical protein
MTDQFNTIKVTSPAGVQALGTQIVTRGQGSVLINNNDASNSVILSESNSLFSADQTGIAPLGPKSSMVFDGTKDVYASTMPGVTVTLYAYPSAISFTESQVINSLFTQGAVSGAPSGIFIPAGSAQQIITMVDVSGYSSYDLSVFFVEATNAVTSARVRVSWFDDLTSGLAVFEEDWWLWVGVNAPSVTAASGYPMTGSGPMHGRYMTVTIDNFTGSKQIAVQYINIFGSNRNVQISDWRQNLLTFTPGIIGATSIISNQGSTFDNVLTTVDNFQTIINTTYLLPCGLYSGRVFYRFGLNGGVATNDAVICNALNNIPTGNTVGTAAANVIVNLPNTAGVEQEGFFNSPRSPCFLLFRAPASSPPQISFSAYADQGL